MLLLLEQEEERGRGYPVSQLQQPQQQGLLQEVARVVAMALQEQQQAVGLAGAAAGTTPV